MWYNLFCLLVCTIQLLILEEIGNKIKALYDKMLKDKEVEDIALINKLDSL